ncbi:hypothetical protein, partial [Bacillus altitudinis]|uniref:hypothetical protein n=1 Tax=Bacillus altitudinis TaxID=293387 RepID=UPI0024AD0D26
VRDALGVHHLAEADAARVCDWYSSETKQSTETKNVDPLPLNGVIDIFYELNSVVFLDGRIG